MVEFMRIDENIAAGPQPSENELGELAEREFQYVVNLRADGEQNQPLSPRDEGIKVQELGMQYLSIPVPDENWDDAEVDNFLQKLRLIPKPVFVHSGTGSRAHAFALIKKSLEEGWSGDETLNQAEQFGLDRDNSQAATFVKNYVDSHRQ